MTSRPSGSRKRRAEPADSEDSKKRQRLEMLTHDVSCDKDSQSEKAKILQIGARTKNKSIPREFCHRYGSRWISFPRWQLGNASGGKFVLDGPLKRCVSFIKEISKRKGGHLFHEPVDPIALQLPDYYDIITDPVDLGAIQRGIELGFYFQPASDKSGFSRAVADIGLVWANAMEYNPASSPVFELAKEFKGLCDAQLIDATTEQESAPKTAEQYGLGGISPDQHVIDHYLFVDDHGRVILPERTTEDSLKGLWLAGVLVRAAPKTTRVPVAYDDAWQLQPLAIHFELADAKDLSTTETIPLIAWVRTQAAWVRLLNPAACISQAAEQWLEGIWISLLFRRCVIDTPKDPMEKLIRSLAKLAHDSRTRGSEARYDEARVRELLLDWAEYAAVRLEESQSVGSCKISDKECKKLVRKLLFDADKHRASHIVETQGKGQESDSGGHHESKDEFVIGSVLAGVVTKVVYDRVKMVFETGQQLVACLRSGEDYTPLLMQNEEVDNNEDSTKEPGYWERDSEGNRVWVRAVSDEERITPNSKIKKRKVTDDNADTTLVGQSSKKLSDILREQPLKCEVGARVRVLFDDQIWYLGNVTAYDKKAGKWHVVFSDGDEDDVGFPDPDVVLMPPVELMTKALDEVLDGIRSGLQVLFQPTMAPPNILKAAGDIKTRMRALLKKGKESLHRHTTGPVFPGQESIEDLQKSFLDRIKSKLFEEYGFTEKLWKIVLSNREVAACSEKETATESATETGGPRSKVTKGKKTKGKVNVMSLEDNMQVENPDSDSVVEHCSANATPKKGKGAKAKAEDLEVGLATDALEAAEPTSSGGAETGKSRQKQRPSRPLTAACSKADAVIQDRPSGRSEPESKGDSEAQRGSEGMDAEGAKRSEWKDTPSWMKRNMPVEVLWGEDWWQAKALKCRKGKVLIRYSGGTGEEEWIPLKSKRLRPPSEDWNKPIVGHVDEEIEVKRSTDKKPFKGCWNLAKIVECDVENNKVKVQYHFRKDLDDEWVTIDVKWIRPVSEGGVIPASDPEGDDNDRSSSDENATSEQAALWPPGQERYSMQCSECLGICLIVTEFLRIFGRSSILMHPHISAIVGLSTDPWSSFNVQNLIEMIETSELNNLLMALFTALLAILLDDDSEPNLMPPDALNWMGHLRRLIEKDVVESERRVLKERVDECYLPEEVLGDRRPPKVIGMGRGKPKIETSVSFGDSVDGVAVVLAGEGLFLDQELHATIVGHPDGLRAAFAGVEMSLSDFGRLGECLKSNVKERIKVLESGETLEDLELAFKGSRPADTEQGEGDVEKQGNTRYLGEHYLGNERAMLEVLAHEEWEGIGVKTRWLLLDWLCGATAGTEALRITLQEMAEHSGQFDKQLTGWTLFLKEHGNMRMIKTASDTWKANKELQAEYIERARVLKEQDEHEKEQKRSDEAPIVRLRNETLGHDSEGRRYWWLPSGAEGSCSGDLAVEVPIPGACTDMNYYAHAGSNRSFSFEPDSRWVFYNSPKEFSELLSYLEGNADKNGYLLKRLRANRQAIEAALAAREQALHPAEGGEGVHDKMNKDAASTPAAPATKSKSPEKASTNVGGSAAQPAMVSTLPAGSIPTFAQNRTRQGGTGALVPASAALPGTAIASGPLPALPSNAGAQAAPGSMAAWFSAGAGRMHKGLPVLELQGMDPFPPRGEYTAREDETPYGIAARLGVDVHELVDMNKEMYQGLHARARFKGGTLVLLPAPSAAALNRPILQTPAAALADLLALIRLEVELLPLSHRLQAALLQWIECAGRPGRVELAAATLRLEHALLAPCAGPPEVMLSRLDGRLLPKGWLTGGRRRQWASDLEKAETASALALCLQEFHRACLDGLRRLRRRFMTPWMWRPMCLRRKAGGGATTVATAGGPRESGEPLVLVPQKGDMVVYLRRGHILQIQSYPQRPWDCLPEGDAEHCIVEDIWYFNGKAAPAPAGSPASSNVDLGGVAGDEDGPPFCCLQLRPVPQGHSLVGRRLMVPTPPLAAGATPGTAGERPVPLGCLVVAYREAPPVMPGGGVVREHLLRWDGPDGGEDWVALDDCRYQLCGVTVESPRAFLATIYYEQRHPEFLVLPKVFRESMRPWAPGTRVRMWFVNEDCAKGGEYYTGVVLEQRAGQDPWDSLLVRWDVGEGEEIEQDYVNPWELHRWDGPPIIRGGVPGQVAGLLSVPVAAGGVAGVGAAGVIGSSTSSAAVVAGMPTVMAVADGKGIVRTMEEAEALPDNGVFVSNEGDMATSIAEMLGVDTDLLVLLNSRAVPGLGPKTKLPKGTQLRVPPEGVRYQTPAAAAAAAAAGSGEHRTDGAAPGASQRRAFPKEDEQFWKGGWNEVKRNVCAAVLRRLFRHRNSSAFIEPVDPEKLGLEDYLTVIKNPMDLGTVQSRLDERRYTAPQAFVADVRRTFENALLYNPEDDPIFKNAMVMLNFFEEIWREEKVREEKARDERAAQKAREDLLREELAREKRAAADRARKDARERARLEKLEKAQKERAAAEASEQSPSEAAAAPHGEDSDGRGCEADSTDKPVEKSSQRGSEETAAEAGVGLAAGENVTPGTATTSDSAAPESDGKRPTDGSPEKRSRGAKREGRRKPADEQAEQVLEASQGPVAEPAEQGRRVARDTATLEKRKSLRGPKAVPDLAAHADPATDPLAGETAAAEISEAPLEVLDVGRSASNRSSPEKRTSSRRADKAPDTEAAAAAPPAASTPEKPAEPSAPGEKSRRGIRDRGGQDLRALREEKPAIDEMAGTPSDDTNAPSASKAAAEEAQSPRQKRSSRGRI